MSTTEVETEISVYMLIEEAEGLDEANDIEDQIQVEGTLTTGPRVRVRKVIPVKGAELGRGDYYVQTYKDPRQDESGIGSDYETNVDVDRNAFAAFAQIAQRAVIKRRYTFASKVPTITGVDESVVLPAVNFQIDQFVIQSTKLKSSWVKLDIELQDLLKAMREQGLDVSNIRQRFVLNDLPFKTVEVINPANMTPEQKQKLGQLWETEFSTQLNAEVYTKPPAP